MLVAECLGINSFCLIKGWVNVWKGPKLGHNILEKLL